MRQEYGGKGGEEEPDRFAVGLSGEAVSGFNVLSPTGRGGHEMERAKRDEGV
ncbi:MAG: hypothetical protein P8124_01940 [Gammaproteobacteria bacterium]